MDEKGLRGDGRFGRVHPAVAAIYYLVVLVVIILSNSPVFLLSAIAAGLLYDVIQRGKKTVRRFLLTGLVVFAMITIINGFFTHNGATVLFYISSNRITKEAFVYGAVMSLVLVSILCWFGSFNVIMTSDKLIHVFGKIAPVIGLIVSMIFRFIPLLQQRFAQIKAGQTALGKDNLKGPPAKIKQFTKEVSALISWSLEASLESADSMTARGYGLKGRTSYSLFKWEAADRIILVLTLMCGICVVAGYHFGFAKMYYYPVITRASDAPFLLEAGIYVLFLALLLIPSVVDAYGEYVWKKSVSGI